MKTRVTFVQWKEEWKKKIERGENLRYLKNSQESGTYSANDLGYSLRNKVIEFFVHLSCDRKGENMARGQKRKEKENYKNRNTKKWRINE